MSNRQLEEAIEQRQDQYIARQLGISTETLGDHPFQIDENSSDDGLVYSWRILWDDTPPEGVAVQGTPGALWSDIQPGGDEDEFES
jgi:hypothetical protein